MTRAHYDRARATGMRISRWRPGSLLRAIAGRSWRSTISCARPTTSPITRRCRRPKNSSCSIASMPGSPARTTATRPRCGCAPSSPRTIFRRSTRRICSPRSSSTSPKLRYRDWDDLIAIARCRRCRSAVSSATSTAKAATAGRPTTRCAPPCRSSITCRIARRTTAISTGSTFRRMRSPTAAPRSKRSTRRKLRPRC